MSNKIGAFALAKKIIGNAFCVMKNAWPLVIGFILLSSAVLYVGVVLADTVPYIDAIVGLIISIISTFVAIGLLYSSYNNSNDMAQMISVGTNKLLPYFVLGIILVAPLSLVLGGSLAFTGVGTASAPATSDANLGGIATDVTANMASLSAMLSVTGVLFIIWLYFVFRFFCAAVILVNTNNGVVESLKKSWKITRGNVLHICGVVILMILVLTLLVFVFGAITALLAYVLAAVVPSSILALIVGVIHVIMQIIQLTIIAAMAVMVYRNLTSESVKPQQFTQTTFQGSSAP